ncbi:sporulation protein [Acinetobacter amyesii]|uniref:sporulation protein n=1 Tax=Acinetobacter amyesii TaxID=2942470 RepID=UPI0022436AD5|nr:sporulation protein [Acinetobacter amyesii]
MLSNLGLQGIKIHTHLYTSQLYTGQSLQGQINFQGTYSNKNINGIYQQLMTQAEVESGDHNISKSFYCTMASKWHLFNS